MVVARNDHMSCGMPLLALAAGCTNLLPLSVRPRSNTWSSIMLERGARRCLLAVFAWSPAECCFCCQAKDVGMYVAQQVPTSEYLQSMATTLEPGQRRQQCFLIPEGGLVNSHGLL